jgi:hypothetical protein
MTWDLVIHTVELVIALPVFWKANRFFNRILSEREEFPPHRHLNGHILFPKGLKPSKMENLE